MRKENIVFALIPYHRFDPAFLIKTGFKKRYKLPRRIRCCGDDETKYDYQTTNFSIGQLLLQIENELKEMGYEMDQNTVLGKKAVGYIKLVERDHIVYIWQ